MLSSAGKIQLPCAASVDLPLPLLLPGPPCSPHFPYTTLFRSMVSAPLVARLPATTPTSSVTEPVATPPITGTSLVPWMVTVTTWLAVPSEETAVKLGRTHV